MWKKYSCGRIVSIDENTIGFVEEGAHPSATSYYTEVLGLSYTEALDEFHKNFCYCVDFPKKNRKTSSRRRDILQSFGGGLFP